MPAIGVQSFRWSLENDQWQGRANTIKAAHEADGLPHLVEQRAQDGVVARLQAALEDGVAGEEETEGGAGVGGEHRPKFVYGTGASQICSTFVLFNSNSTQTPTNDRQGDVWAPKDCR